MVETARSEVFNRHVSPYSCKTTVNNALLTLILPLYSINPNFLNLFIKKFTRERVVPTIPASVYLRFECPNPIRIDSG